MALGSPRRALVAIVAVAVAFTMTAAACSSGSSPAVSDAQPDTVPSAPGPRTGGTLVMAVASDPGGWNPATDVWSTSATQIARAVFDQLVVYDENNQWRPQLAQSITPNVDFTDWTITLRDGPTFSDGTPVDSAAVRRNLEAQRSSPLAGPWLGLIASIVASDARTVHVLMKSPWSTFPQLLAGQPGFVAAPAMLDDPAGSARPIGSGPFTFRSWAPGTSLSVARNTAYWQAGQPRVDAIDFRVIADPAARTDALLNGRVDVIASADAAQLKRLGDEAAANRTQLVLDRIGEAPKLAVALNTVRFPFVDFLARQAITYATDRKQLSTVVYGGVFEPVTGPVGESSPWFSDQLPTPFDLGHARELVKQYEVFYGKPLTFTLGVPNRAPELALARLWQSQLALAGIAAEVVPSDPTQLEAVTRAGDFMASLIEGFADYHPDLAYPVLHRSALVPLGQVGPNPTRFGTDAIDEALDAARATVDLSKQVDAYRVVQNELVGGMPYVFLVAVAQGVGARTDVRDLTQWTTAGGERGLGMVGGTISLSQVWVDRAARPSE